MNVWGSLGLNVEYDWGPIIEIGGPIFLYKLRISEGSTSLGLNVEYDWGPIIEIGGPIFLYKLRILEGSTSFREGSVLSLGQ